MNHPKHYGKHDKELKVVIDPMDDMLELSKYYYYVDTETTSYRSTDLNRVMLLWKEKTDGTAVTNVGRIG